MTIKNPTAWSPQPLGYGVAGTQSSSNLIDQSSNLLIDELSNQLIDGTITLSGKIPIVWSDTAA